MIHCGLLTSEYHLPLTRCTAAIAANGLRRLLPSPCPSLSTSDISPSEADFYFLTLLHPLLFLTEINSSRRFRLRLLLLFESQTTTKKEHRISPKLKLKLHYLFHNTRELLPNLKLKRRTTTTFRRPTPPPPPVLPTFTSSTLESFTFWRRSTTTTTKTATKISIISFFRSASTALPSPQSGPQCRLPPAAAAATASSSSARTSLRSCTLPTTFEGRELKNRRRRRRRRRPPSTRRRRWKRRTYRR